MDKPLLENLYVLLFAFMTVKWAKEAACKHILASRRRNLDKLSSFQVLTRCGADVAIVSTEHLVDVFERSTLGLLQRGGSKQRPGEIDAGEDGERDSVAESGH